jgi:heptosyltransferase-2
VTSAEKILVVGPSWVGDMVMAQALYRVLARRFPGAEVHVVAPPWSAPVLERMPEVARAIELDVPHGKLDLGRRRALGAMLKAEHYSRAIVLPRSAKAALVPWFARIPKRTGFRGEWRYGLLNDVRRMTPELDQTVKRFAALGLSPEATIGNAIPPELRPRLTVDAQNVSRLRNDYSLAAEQGLAALLPGAEYGPAKRWPAERYAALAATLVGRGLDVIVLGSAKEHALGEAVASADARVRNLCGRTSLADVIDLLSAASVAVSNDSGLMHVAAAAGTPLVAIYGSSSPAFTPPLTENVSVLYLALECSPCFARQCPLGHLRCLGEISVQTVLAAAEARLAEGRGSDRAVH